MDAEPANGSDDVSQLLRAWSDGDQLDLAELTPIVVAKAKTAYGEFFTLWKDADPDVPILVQAKTEYARLQ